MADQKLVARLQEPDMQDLADWEAASALNAPSAQEPVIVEWLPTEIGVGTILDVLGPTEGAAFLDLLQSQQDSVISWGMHLILSGRLDISRASTRAQMDALTQAGALTEAQREALLSVSRRERHPSWAEANGVIVDARAVGLARGGV